MNKTRERCEKVGQRKKEKDENPKSGHVEIWEEEEEGLKDEDERKTSVEVEKRW